MCSRASTVALLYLSAFLAVWGVPGRCEAEKAPPDLTISKAEWREDLRAFATELPKRHKNLFHSTTRELFDAAVAKLDADLPALDAHQIVVRMGQIAATVGDGHTVVHLPRGFGRYPLAPYWFGGELRVMAVADKTYERALGARIVEIGGLPIDQVQARVATCFPSAENENEWYVLNSSAALIVRPEVLNALGVVPDLTKATFTFENDRGERFTLDLVPIVADATQAAQWLRPAAIEPLTRQRPTERFWFTYLPESKTMYVSWRGYDSLGAHARKLFQAIDANPTERLVIDLRQNDGGDFFEGRKHMIRPIAERPALNQKGRLFVVVGRRTFSAAMVNAIDFREQTQAILVGEPIGERPNSYSENDELTLPNSRVVVSYSTRYYEFVEEDVPAVLPDRRIDPTWEAYAAGKDPVMEWILSGAPD